MSQTYFAILTAVGEAKLANATALGVPLELAVMAVGDGNGNLPVPNRLQTALVREVYEAPLNELKIDPANASQIIAELVIPETEGGYWLREMGLKDAAGDLIAVANCPPSYKPEMAEGSGRTQVLRMVLIVSSTAAVQLKIDPSVVLATREFVTTTVAAELAKLDAKASVKAATTANLAALSGLLTVDGVALAAGDRVLVKNQAAGAANGIYVVAVGAWARAADADANSEVTPGLLVAVEQGTENADTVWQLTTNAPITIGTTALTFELTAALTATQADAEGGTNNTRRMTALRVFQAIRSAAAVATDTLRGVLRIATKQEVINGVLENAAVTPKTLSDVLDYTIIYPAGGSAESPANVAVNSRYVLANPFPGHAVVCLAEINHPTAGWGESPPGDHTSTGGTRASTGVHATQMGDNIVVQTLISGLTYQSDRSGDGFNNSTTISTPLPCRVKVWKLKGASA